MSLSRIALDLDDGVKVNYNKMQTAAGFDEEKFMNKTFPQETQVIMNERFGRDTLIGLATVEGNVPSVRTVDAYYENGAFYIITYGQSNKMKQLEKNSNVGICGDWFTAHGKGVNLGWFCKEENKDIADKLKKAFSEWIDNGHNNFDDENTIILCVRLTDGILFSHGKRYDIDFTHIYLHSEALCAEDASRICDASAQILG